MTAPLFDPRVRDLAQGIYRDLVSSAVGMTDAGPKLSGDAGNLAKLSLELAAAFFAKEDQLNAANLPQNQDFKVRVEDLAGWTK